MNIFKIKKPQGEQLLKSYVISIIYTSVLLAGGTHGQYSGKASSIIYKVDEILITNGYCKDKNECQRKEYRFTTGDDDSINAQFYEIDKPKVISQIVDLYTSVYFKNNKNINVKLYFNSFSHEENRWYKTSFLKMMFDKQDD